MHQTLEALNAFRDAFLGASRPCDTELKILFARVLKKSFSPTEQEGHCQTCGLDLPWQENGKIHCKTCVSKRGTPHKTIALSTYEGGLGVLIAAAKYTGWAEPLRIAGELLGTELKIRGGSSLQKKVIVPMPSPWIRTLHRGIDHSMVIAREVSRVTDWPIHRVLKRKWVAPQVGLSRSERMRGGKGLEAIPISTVSLSIPGTEVVLIDDVRTTGATLDKASRMCMALGARRVIAGVVAMRASDD